MAGSAGVLGVFSATPDTSVVVCSATPAAHAESHTYSGPLWKRSRRLKTWRRRHAVLHSDGTFCFYRRAGGTAEADRLLALQRHLHMFQVRVHGDVDAGDCALHHSAIFQLHRHCEAAQRYFPASQASFTVLFSSLATMAKTSASEGPSSSVHNWTTASALISPKRV